jgi:hypothetical protein
MTQESSAAVPQIFVERFAKAFAAFVEAVRAAVNEAAQNPALNGNRALLVWQTQGLPLLEKENETVQKAMALYLVGETGTIVNVASEERHLAKNLDGYDLSFAGAEGGKALDRLETNVVIAAYQVCAAAGVP